MNDQELEDKIKELETEIKKRSILGNENLPIIIKWLLMAIFAIVMLIFRPDVLVKIVEILAK